MPEDIDASALAGFGLGSGSSEGSAVNQEDKPVKELTDDELKQRIWGQLSAIANPEVDKPSPTDDDPYLGDWASIPTGYFQVKMHEDASHAGFMMPSKMEVDGVGVGGSYQIRKEPSGHIDLNRTADGSQKSVSRGVAEKISTGLATEISEALRKKKPV